MNLKQRYDGNHIVIALITMVIILLEFPLLFDTSHSQNNTAKDNQPVIEIPVAWCAVSGSPAAENPSIPNANSGVDTTTEAVLDSRLERINTNIFLEQAGIKFVPNNLNGSKGFSYPIIADQNTTVGSQGDILIESRGNQEYVNTVNECRIAWQDKSGEFFFDGIPIINVNLFVRDNGSIRDTGGIAECSFPTENCGITPHNGSLVLIDNYYTIPGISSLPDTYTNCTNSTWNFWNKDPMDQLLGHELSHALSLDHNENSGSLMKVCQQFNGPGQTINNISLNQTEIDRIRDLALTVMGARITTG